MSFRVLNPSESSRWYRQLGKGAALLGAGFLGYAGLSSVFGGRREEAENPGASSSLQLQKTIDSLKSVTQAQVSFSETIQTFDHPVSAQILNPNPSLLSQVEVIDEDQSFDMEYYGEHEIVGSGDCFRAEGGEFRVNTYTAGIQKDAVISKVGSGFVVVWQSDGQDGSDYGIYGQRYDNLGVKQDSEFLVNTYTAGYQGYPAISELDSGFVVVWNGQPDGGGNYGVFGQRFDILGVKQGSEFIANTYTAGWQVNPSVAEIDNGFVIVWHSPQDGSDYGIYAQRYDNSGVKQGSEFRVNTITAGAQLSPDISGIENGFVVVWEHENTDTYGQRFDLSGNKLGSQFIVNTYTTSNQEAGSIAAIDGGFVVVWHSNGQDGSGYGVYGQRYDNLGVKQGSEFQVNTYTTSDQKMPSVNYINSNSR